MSLTNAIELDRAEYSLLEAMMLTTEPLPELNDLLKRPQWQLDAACRGVGVEHFFPSEASGLMQARRVCVRCPVSKDCLDYALSDPSLKGIWAGTSERRRRRLRVAGNLSTPST